MITHARPHSHRTALHSGRIVKCSRCAEHLETIHDEREAQFVTVQRLKRDLLDLRNRHALVQAELRVLRESQPTTTERT